jgi:signal peptidase II
MLKKDLKISLLLFAVALIVDFAWKFRIISEDTIHINRGFIFGSLQDLPASLTLVTLCSIGGFLIFLYVLLILLLPRDLISLKAGLGLLAGGVLANVIDRAVHGGTLDFIPMELPFLPPIIFNPADAFQWLGAALVIHKLLTKDKISWPKENQRGFNLVNPKEQIKFAAKFAAISACTCLVMGVFALSYLTLTLKSLHIYLKSPMIGFSLSYIAISLFCVLISFFAGLLISQRVAGPLYAFEKFIDSIIRGEDRTLKLREADSFKNLEAIAKNITDHINNIKN